MNERFARLMIHHLIEHGVRKFCIAPGSRSTPLAFAAAQDDRADTLVHFDERGLAFHAMGYAKSSKSPVAIIVTSGTAVANLFPAIMEAFHEQVPLIVLTADRPPELRDCGANQATNQVKIFSDHVRWQCDLPCPDPAIADNYIGSTMAHAIYMATHAPKGPVHLNCMFREPFFTGAPLVIKTSTTYEPSHTTLSTHTIEQWAKRLSQAERGVIVVGALTTARSLKSINALAEHLHWPILPDILSGLRSEGLHHNEIPYFDVILKTATDLKPDCILHFGDRITSKTLAEWTFKSAPKTYALVADHPYRHDPHHALTHRLQCDPTIFCEQLIPFIPRRASWLDTWKSLSAIVENHLDPIVPPQSEPGLFRFLHHHLPAHWALFLANSMVVRDADQFFFPRFFRGPIFGKRGLAGIDGNIATAIGIAEGSQRPTLAVLGDLATLHDLNSLALIKKAKHPVVFCVINNRGGGIFNFLPIAEKKDVFEEFFAAAHTFQFEEAAKMFQLPYHSLNESSILSRALKEEKSCILELTTNRQENVTLHTTIFEELKTCLSSASCTVS
jgi:2-succinyl-5-enolpyruvyl-6-hydroxy-3-cyclohexene-1-carboxylate synthase